MGWDGMGWDEMGWDGMGCKYNGKYDPPSIEEVDHHCNAHQAEDPGSPEFVLPESGESS